MGRDGGGHAGGVDWGGWRLRAGRFDGAGEKRIEKKVFLLFLQKNHQPNLRLVQRALRGVKTRMDGFFGGWLVLRLSKITDAQTAIVEMIVSPYFLGARVRVSYNLTGHYQFRSRGSSPLRMPPAPVFRPLRPPCVIGNRSCPELSQKVTPVMHKNEKLRKMPIHPSAPRPPSHPLPPPFRSNSSLFVDFI